MSFPFCPRPSIHVRFQWHRTLCQLWGWTNIRSQEHVCGHAEKSKWAHTEGRGHTRAAVPSLVLHWASITPRHLVCTSLLLCGPRSVKFDNWLCVGIKRNSILFSLGSPLEAYWLIHHLVNMDIYFASRTFIFKQFIRCHGTLHWCCSALTWVVCVCACVFLCVHVTVNLILVKPDASFCWGLMACQLTKYLTCFYLRLAGLVSGTAPFIYFTCHWLTLKQQIVALSRYSSCNYVSSKLWGSSIRFEFASQDLIVLNHIIFPSSTSSFCSFSTFVLMLSRLATQQFTERHCHHLQRRLSPFSVLTDSPSAWARNCLW